MMVVLLVIPFNPVWQFGNDRIKQVIESQGSDVTGVRVQVENVRLGLFYVQADITGFQVGNPEGYPTSPYFIKCENIHSDISWVRLLTSGFKLLEINDLRIRGISVNIEQKIALTSNVNEILSRVAKHPLGKLLEDQFEHEKKRKYIIDRIHIEDMHVNVLMEGAQVADVYVPPMLVSGIGAQQGGVALEELIGLAVNALSVSALQAQDREIKVQTLKDIKKLHHDDEQASKTLRKV
jgi:hypothetical protein